MPDLRTAPCVIVAWFTSCGLCEARRHSVSSTGISVDVSREQVGLPPPPADRYVPADDVVPFQFPERWHGKLEVEWNYRNSSAAGAKTSSAEVFLVRTVQTPTTVSFRPAAPDEEYSDSDDEDEWEDAKVRVESGCDTGGDIALLKLSSPSDEAGWQAAKNEVKIMKHLRSESVHEDIGYFVRLWDYSLAVHDKHRVSMILMEGVQGGDLFKRFVNDQKGLAKYTDQQAALWFWDALEGLSILHFEKISHGDISLRNILVTYPDLRAKLAGFSASCGGDPLIVKCKEDAVTTMAYAPPEKLWLPPPAGSKLPQIMQRPVIDASKHDIWSLGIALYMLALRRYPDFIWSQVSESHTRHLIRNFKIEQIQSKLTGIDANLRSLLEGMLNPDPAARKTAAELQAIAKRWLSALGTAVLKNAPETTEIPACLDTV